MENTTNGIQPTIDWIAAVLQSAMETALRAAEERGSFPGGAVCISLDSLCQEAESALHESESALHESFPGFTGLSEWDVIGESFYVKEGGKTLNCKVIALAKIATCEWLYEQGFPMRSGGKQLRSSDWCKMENGFAPWQGAVGRVLILNGVPFCRILIGVSGSPKESDDAHCATRAMNKATQCICDAFGNDRVSFSDKKVEVA